MYQTRIQKEIPNILTDYYDHKLVIKDIQKKYGVGKSTVIKILKNEGSGGRSRDEYDNNKYSCNEDYFETIDSHQKAYWFGFIAADGNLYNQKLQIALQDTDRGHLEAFCSDIGYDGKLHNDKGAPKLIIARKKIFYDLKKHGLCENKTFKLDEDCFSKIPEKYLASAYLGYIDGDGCFSINRRKCLQFYVVGNESFLNKLCDFFQEKGVEISRPKHDKRTKQTFYVSKTLSQEKACIMFDILYSEDINCLKRKKEKLLWKIS